MNLFSNSLQSQINSAVSNIQEGVRLTSGANSTKALQGGQATDIDYIRIPLDTAKKLRWLDKEDLTTLVRIHTSEKADLLSAIQALRNLAISKGATDSDLPPQTVKALKAAGNDAACEIATQSSLLLSALAEIDALKSRVDRQQSLIQQLRHQTDLNPRLGGDQVPAGPSSIATDSINDVNRSNQSDNCSVSAVETAGGELAVEEGIDRTSGGVHERADTTNMPATRTLKQTGQDIIEQVQQATVLLASIAECSSTGEQGSGQVDGGSCVPIDDQVNSIQAVLTQVASLASTIEDREQADSVEPRTSARGSNADLFQLQYELRKQNAALEHAEQRLIQQKEQGIKRMSDAVAQADERAREYLHRAEKAEKKAQEAQVKVTEQSVQLKVLESKASSAANSAVASKKIKQLEGAKEDAEGKCAQLEEQQIQLLQQIREQESKLNDQESVLVELRDTKQCLLDAKYDEQQLNEYKKRAESEVSARALAEDQILETSQLVQSLTKQLQVCQHRINISEQECADKQKLLTALEKSIDSQVKSRLVEMQSNRQHWPQAAVLEIHNHQQKIQGMESTVQDLQQKLKIEHSDKQAVQQSAAQHAQLVSDLERRLYEQCVALEDEKRVNDKQCSDLNNQLQKAQQNMQGLQDKISYYQKQQIEQTRRGYKEKGGGEGQQQANSNGTTNDNVANSRSGSMGGQGSVDRLREYGVDALYLKNVLIKFLQAYAGGKVAERDALLPVIATLLQVSASEFAALKGAVQGRIRNPLK